MGVVCALFYIQFWGVMCALFYIHFWEVMCALIYIQFWFHSGAVLKHFLQKQLGEERISLALTSGSDSNM